MVDFSSFLPAGLPTNPTLLPTLLDLLPMGVMYYTPVVDATGGLTDLALNYLNQAAQRMTQLPAQPGTTYRQQFPTTEANEAWDFHRRSWLAQEPQHLQFYYDADGFDSYFRVTAQRLGDGLLVVFTDTRDETRSQAEEALRESQAAERKARAEVEAQQAELRAVFEQAPVAIALLQGPTHVVEFANTRMAQLWGRPLAQVVGQPHFTALPDLAGQGFEAVFEAVWRTGEPHYLQEQAVTIDRAEQLYQGYFNITYQPSYDGQGQRTGIIASAIEVTDQVLARQHVEQLNLVAQAAREQAEAERQRLTQMLLRMPANIALLKGPAHVYDFVNPEYERLFPRRGPLGRPLREVIPELEGQGFYELLDRVYETGEPFYQAEAEAWADYAGTGEAQRRYYRTAFEPIRDAQGHVTEILNFAMDVTAQVEARQQVEQLNAELEARVQARTREALALQADLLAAAQRQVQVRESFYQVFEQTPAAVSLLRGPTYRFEYVNPVYQQVFAGRQLVGHDFAEVLPDAAAQGYLALLDGVYQTGETFFGAEVPFVSEQPDAPTYTTYFNFTYQAYRENGEIVGISTFALDVTEQVLARQEREAQRSELQRLFEQAPVAIAVFRGPQYVIELANLSVCALWGRTQQQALGTPLFELLPEVAGQGFEQLLDQVRTTGEPFVAHELPSFIDRHGRRDTVYWNFVYAPLREADGTIERVTVVATEGTEQVLARQQVHSLNETLTTTNDELGESNRQLTRTNIDLDNFIYTASHDLKAPITNIEGLLLALEHELPTAARTGDVSLMLTMMQDATERFRRTIDHLTDLSRLQKEHNPANDAVALAPVVEAVHLDLTPLLTQTQGQLTVSIAENLTVTFAEKNLRSVVYNLLSNAFKYHHSDRVPEVQLRGWLADDHVVLEVQDNGLGLDLVQGQDKLFAMFQRLHTHVEGTGVGLYMVKRILENAGGRIEVTSKLGQGSTFRVYFQR